MKKKKKIEKAFEVRPGQYDNEWWIKLPDGEFLISPSIAEKAILLTLDKMIDFLNENP